MAARRPPSELECFTLGLIWQFGPCTPYQIRKQLLDSPSTQWSGSGGSIYPLMRRLKSRGLLRVRHESSGRRKHETYSITAAGVKVLKEWVGPPMADEAVTVAHDPLRSRARFLGVLTRRQRLAWVEAALEVLDTVEAKVKEWAILYGDDDEFLQLIAQSGARDVRSRRKWLRDARERMKEQSAGRSRKV